MARGGEAMGLAEQILADASAWGLYGGRFVPRGRNGDGASVPTSIELSEGGAVATVRLGALPAADRVRVARALRRSGYGVKPLPNGQQVAHRFLRGARGALAEVRVLERVALDLESADALTRRGPVRGRAKAFPRSVLTALRRDARWTLQWIGASRRGAFRPVTGWNVLAACTAAVEDGETVLEIFVQLWPKHSRADRAAAARALGALLRPEGYGVVRLGNASLAQLVMMDKRVVSLASVRRERRRLDGVLFGA